VSGEAASGIPDARDVTIKAAEAESHTLYVAGEAVAGTLVRVFANDELVGEVRTAQDGTWLLEAKKDVPVGEVVFRVEAAAEGPAESTPVIEASAPFMHYADGVVLEPVVTAESEDQTLLSDASMFPTPAYVIIRRGDNLWRISRRNYGRGIKYKAIFEANRDRIRNPHWIFPGQVFVVPTRDRSWDTVER
jgi:nucleoid-associated protein YgaU